MARQTIKSIRAREVYTRRVHPGVETVIKTEGGQEGRAVCTGGHSVGSHEVQFVLDGGGKWNGEGVMKAVENVNKIIGPALLGMDVTDQTGIDNAMLRLTPSAKKDLGGNAIASVSAAALKAGAACMDIPLYRYIGGENARYLPVPGVPAFLGHERWGGGVTTPGGKPTYDFVMHGFNSFAEASYAGWEIQQKLDAYMKEKGISVADSFGYYLIRPGFFQSDEELWQIITDIIAESGMEGKVGIQVDIAADTYYDRKNQTYYGLFSGKPKTRDQLMELYISAVKNYPFVIIEDPFHEDDYESHAELSKLIDIQVVGDDLFTTDIKRLSKGIRLGAANTMLLKVNQIGTISEALETVQFAYQHGYGVIPCESRGEGVSIADYCVGINASSVREVALGEIGNRFMEIEQELGSKARFLGTKGLKGRRFQALL